MSKGLQALKEIELKWQYGVFTFIPNFEVIEKELKAFAIINKYFYSEHIIHDLYCLGATDEEIDLVREVMKE